ncbi:MAG: cupin domain-containing protein [Ruminococcaceae bacterium]|nr:cupin domain-containing protein [Oscillospiraceae bacterium]
MLTISQPSRPGFEPVVTTDRFKCAFLTHGEGFTYGEVRELKRHNKTDEVFVLLSGKATMLILENDRFTETPLQPGTAYNVCTGTWHYLAASEDAVVFVTESSDTSKANTDVLTLAQAYNLEQK